MGIIRRSDAFAGFLYSHLVPGKQGAFFFFHPSPTPKRTSSSTCTKLPDFTSGGSLAGQLA